MKVTIKKRISTILKFEKEMLLMISTMISTWLCLSYKCILLGVWVYVPLKMSLDCKCTCVEVRAISNVILQETSILYFEIGSFIGPELTRLS